MFRFTGERRAIAAAVMAFYGFLYLLVSLQPPPGWGAAFGGLAGVYGLGFLGLVAGYFWGRWYAMGVGLSGLLTGALSLWQIGAEPVLLFYAGTHGLAALLLWGHAMAKAFDGRGEWRERFHLDEGATHRLGKLVVKLGVSLPYLVIYSLQPRDEGAGAAILAITGLTLAGAGVWAVFKMRSWGIFALGGAAAAVIMSLGFGSRDMVAISSGYLLNTAALGVAGAIIMSFALAPFVPLIASKMRQA